METFIEYVDFVAAVQHDSRAPATPEDRTWRAIYEQHARAVYYLALRTVGDPALAEDVTHDVFLKAIRNLSQFRGQSSLRTWLYRITINHCRNVQNTWQHRHIINTDNTAVLEDSLPHAATPVRLLEVKEIGQRIQRTLDALPEEYRLLLLLVADEQLSYQEIAALTDQNADAVRGKLYRARKAFLAEFQKTE